jgi:carboxymethylenebutenolidase
MVHEVWGLDEEMLRHANRLADAGYLTLAVDLFSGRLGLQCLVSTMRAYLTGVGQPFTNIEAGRRWLLDSAECTDKVGVIGFCMGGHFAWLSARTGFAAASVNYGRLPRNLDDIVAGSCPIVGSYGGRDSTLRGVARTLDAALDKAGITRDVVEYPTAGHAFLNGAANGPRIVGPLSRMLHIGPDAVAAEDAWRRIGSFFETHLLHRARRSILGAEPCAQPLPPERSGQRLRHGGDGLPSSAAA